MSSLHFLNGELPSKLADEHVLCTFEYVVPVTGLQRNEAVISQVSAMSSKARLTCRVHENASAALL